MRVQFLILCVILIACSQSKLVKTKTHHFDLEKNEMIEIERWKDENGIILPEQLGGINEIKKNIKYPALALNAGVSGYVYATCYIDEKGICQKVLIEDGLGYGCDEEVISVLTETQFLPGLKDDIPVKTMVTIPIKFDLNFQYPDEKTNVIIH